MKETVLDVLMYLFENYMDEGPEFNPDQEALALELTQAGFPRGQINKAFHWLEGLSSLRVDTQDGVRQGRPQSLRIYTPKEMERLNAECRGFILFMEQSGVLDAPTRELVVDRVMALDSEEIDVEQLKWVIMMVLYNQSGHENAYALLEDLVFDEMQGHLQ